MKHRPRRRYTLQRLRREFLRGARAFRVLCSKDRPEAARTIMALPLPRWKTQARRKAKKP